MKINLSYSLKNNLFNKFTESEKLLAYNMVIANNKLINLRQSIGRCIEYEKIRLQEINEKDPNLIFFHQYKLTEHVRQVLMMQPLTLSYMKQIHFNKKLVFRIPPKWWKFFEESGIPVNKPLNLLGWILYRIKRAVIEQTGFIKMLKNRLMPTLNEISENLVLTINSTELNFRMDSRQPMLNFYTWIKQNTVELGIRDYRYLLENKNNDVNKDFSRSLSRKTMFSASVMQILSNFFDLLKKSNFSLKFLLDVVIYPYSFLAYFSLSRDKMQQIQYIFVPSSDSWVKPLWLYQAENFGSIVTYVNLSSDLVPTFNLESNYYSWYHLSAWNNLWSTCEGQNDSFREAKLSYVDTNFKIVGVPDWIDINEDIDNSKKIISVFDFEPHLFNFGQTSLNDYGYTNIKNTVKFLSDIAEVTSNLEIKCLHKPKRLIGHRRYAEYSDCIDILQSRYLGFKSINESVAPRKLINVSKLVISMPFTSTALIATQSGVKNCFYDPSGLINLNDFARQGVEILNNKSDLLAWIRSNL